MKHYLVIAGNPNCHTQPTITVYPSKEALQHRINEDNHESIREDCRPHYLQLGSERIHGLCPRYPEQYILEFEVIVPRPVDVVTKYLVE
jgi:hypothetical protein